MASKALLAQPGGRGGPRPRSGGGCSWSRGEAAEGREAVDEACRCSVAAITNSATCWATSPNHSMTRPRRLQGRIQTRHERRDGQDRAVRGLAGTGLARAAGSLREGLSEMFTINRLGLPSELRRCLGTTNIIDNGHSALRDRVRRVKHWQSGSMALRWTAVAFDAIAQGFRRIMGYKHLWMLKAALEEPRKIRSLSSRPRPDNVDSSPSRCGDFPLNLGHHLGASFNTLRNSW